MTRSSRRGARHAAARTYLSKIRGFAPSVHFYGRANRTEGATATWTDLVAGYSVTSTGAAMPVAAASGGWTFDGGDYLQSSDQALVDLMDGSIAYTLYIASTPTTLGGTRVMMCVGSTTTSSHVYHGCDASGLDLISRYEAAQTTNTGSVARTVNQTRRLSAIYTGSANSAWQRGAIAINALANTRIATCNRFIIGALMLGGGFAVQWIGDIQDVILFSSVNHDASTRAAIESAMNVHWGT